MTFRPLSRRAIAFAIVSIAFMPAAQATDNRLVVPQISAGGIVNLQSRQQRLDFQQRQQFNRELDSLVTRQSQRRLDIPVMKPNCQPRQLGNSVVAQTC